MGPGDYRPVSEMRLLRNKEHMGSSNKTTLIAPCGMNCGICMAYLRDKNKCSGCRETTLGKPVTRLECKIKNCEFFQNTNSRYCFQCKKFPCNRLKHLDKRYRTKYSMSMIENLDNIREFGIRQFLRNEKERWACSECGGTICVHKAFCYSCGKSDNKITSPVIEIYRKGKRT